jgi:hypothetical protein
MMQGPGGGQLGMHEQGMLQQVASGASFSHPSLSPTPLSSYSSLPASVYRCSRNAHLDTVNGVGESTVCDASRP